jgi:hypothetical protein
MFLLRLVQPVALEAKQTPCERGNARSGVRCRCLAPALLPPARVNALENATALSAWWRDPRRRAAIVYDDGVAVGLLLHTFAAELASSGVRVGGVLELSGDAPGCGPASPLRVSDVASGETFSLCTHDAGRRACAPDPARMAEIGSRMSRARSCGAEVVFLTRFGRREAAGLGFSPHHRIASDGDVPVLTAVPRSLSGNWIAFHGGAATLLDSRLWVLRDWWRDLSPTAAASMLRTS